MKILVSACLLGENCKYSGGNNYSEKAAAFVQEHEVIPVCPEVLGGLSVPRTPAEIVNGEVVTKDGVSVDAAFRAVRPERWPLPKKTVWNSPSCSRAAPVAVLPKYTMEPSPAERSPARVYLRPCCGKTASPCGMQIL